MIERVGDLWEHLGRVPLCITTGGQVSAKGECAMPRGCARQARERFPALAAQLGRLLQERGNHVHELDGGLISFPVEDSPWVPPSLHLIVRSAAELRTLVDTRRWPQVVVPRPGCGSGGLAWRDVRPLLLPHFDDRFLVITDRP